MPDPLVLVETRPDGVTLLRLNRPPLNPLSTALLRELEGIATGLAADPSVKAVVVTGSEKAFAAGADVSEFTADGAAPAVNSGIRAGIDTLAAVPRPVIAAINGFALGGGCELAMACTIRIAADTARLGQPEINLGIIPGYAGTQRLARLIGRGRALELLLTGDHVMAPEAHRLGLVNRVVPAAELMTEVRTLATALAAKAPVAVRYILDAVNKGLDMGFGDAQVFEATLFGLVSSTEDMREGTRAFLDKRKAQFTGK